MKSTDLLTITTVALGTAALTVATLWTGPLEAGGETHLPAAELTKPKLISHGMELTLASAEGRAFKAGDEPVFELTAVNTNTLAANTCVRVSVSCSAPANRLARVIQIPTVLWEEERAITLQPHESKALSLSVHQKLPANKLVSVSLLEVETSQKAVPALNAQAAPAVPLKRFPQLGIVMLSFSTTTQASQPLPLVSVK